MVSEGDKQKHTLAKLREGKGEEKRRGDRFKNYDWWEHYNKVRARYF